MSSEIIVVLVLFSIAIGFILWVRMNDENHEKKQTDQKGESQSQ
jgi:hypothetical protein